VAKPVFVAFGVVCRPRTKEEHRADDDPDLAQALRDELGRGRDRDDP
jgi:hypothetical protein